MPKIELTVIKNILETFHADNKQFLFYCKPIKESERSLYLARGDDETRGGIFDYPKLNLSAVLSDAGCDLDLSDYDFSEVNCQNINFGKINLTNSMFVGANLSFTLFDIKNETRLKIKIDDKTETFGSRGLGRDIIKELKRGPFNLITGFLQKAMPISDVEENSSQMSQSGRSSSQPSRNLEITADIQRPKGSPIFINAEKTPSPAIGIDDSLLLSSQSSSQKSQISRRLSRSEIIKKNKDAKAAKGYHKITSFFDKPLTNPSAIISVKSVVQKRGRESFVNSMEDYTNQNLAKRPEMTSQVNAESIIPESFVSSTQQIMQAMGRLSDSGSPSASQMDNTCSLVWSEDSNSGDTQDYNIAM